MRHPGNRSGALVLRPPRRRSFGERIVPRLQLFDTVLRMRALLIERRVTLTPEHADAHEGYGGPGARAEDAWEVFCAVAREPATDPVWAWGDMRSVRHAGFSFNASYCEATKAEQFGRAETLEHYLLSVTRYFYIGDDGMIKGLTLYIDVAPAEELRVLQAEHWEEGDPLADRDDPAALAADAATFASYVEASPAFRIALSRGLADRFWFEIDDVG